MGRDRFGARRRGGTGECGGAYRCVKFGEAGTFRYVFPHA